MNGPPDATAAEPPVVPFWAHLLPFFAYFFAGQMFSHLEPWNHAAGALAAGAALVWLKPWRDAAVWAHVMPFALWLSVMIGLGEAAAWKYNVRTLAGFAALAAARPWRWYGSLRAKNLPLALAVGAGVFALWVGFESPWFRALWPAGAEGYERWLVGPLPGGFGKLREPLTAFPYDPALTGWLSFTIHMLGTSVAIAMIEEFFWRGFLYRWLSGKNFLKIPLTHWDRTMFFAVAILFGLEHAEWMAGILCGLAFAGLLWRTGDLWAVVIAHGVTNFLLGLYVLFARQWHFW
jgi:uncharacterized protein